MSSDATQSILRLTLLASATAAFMVVWNGDSSRTIGMTLAERNQRVVPAHAIGNRNDVQMLARRPIRIAEPVTVKIATPVVASPADSVALPGGRYRVVFEDGRVEWLTVIDRGGMSKEHPRVISTTVNGERAHVIRVADRGVEVR